MLISFQRCGVAGAPTLTCSRVNCFLLNNNLSHKKVIFSMFARMGMEYGSSKERTGRLIS